MDYRKLKEELQTRRPTVEDVDAIAKSSLIVAAAIQSARINNGDFETAMVTAVVNLSILLDEMEQEYFSRPSKAQVFVMSEAVCNCGHGLLDHGIDTASGHNTCCNVADCSCLRFVDSGKRM